MHRVDVQIWRCKVRKQLRHGQGGVEFAGHNWAPRNPQEALSFACPIGDLLPRTAAMEVVGQGLVEPLNDDGVALAIEVRKGALTVDEDLSDDKLNFG